MARTSEYTKQHQLKKCDQWQGHSQQKENHDKTPTVASSLHIRTRITVSQQHEMREKKSKSKCDDVP